MSPNNKGVCFKRSMHHENCCYSRRTGTGCNRHPRLISETARNCPEVSAKLVVRAQILAWDCLVVEGRL